MNDRGCRRTRHTLLALMAAVVWITSGCGSQVALTGLRPFDERPRPERPVAWRQGALAPDYEIRESDALRLATASGGSFEIQGVGSDGTKYVQNRADITLPMWFGDFFAVIEVVVKGRTSVICFSGSDTAECNVDLRRKKTVAEWLSADWEKAGLKAEVVPLDPGEMRPNDEVEVDLAYELSFEKQAPLTDIKGLIPQSVHRRSTVTGEGTITLPRIRIVSPLLLGVEKPPTPNPTIPLYRAVGGATEAFDSDVSVWWPYGKRDQRPLWRLERCLNVITWPYDPQCASKEAWCKAAEVEKAWCEAAGVDQRFSPQDRPAIFRWQRYRLQAAQRQWVLVDVRGQRHPLPWRYGISVEEAVVSAYAKTTGRELLADSFDEYHGPYATVVPAPGTDEAPFFGQLPPVSHWREAPPRLAAVGVRPGDTIFITRLIPQERP